MTRRWIWLVPSKICMIVDLRAISAGRWPAGGPGIATDSARGSGGVVRLRLVPADVAGVVENGPGAVPGGGDEVAADLVGDLDALVPEPAGDLDQLSRSTAWSPDRSPTRPCLTRRAGAPPPTCATCSWPPARCPPSTGNPAVRTRVPHRGQGHHRPAARPSPGASSPPGLLPRMRLRPPGSS